MWPDVLIFVLAAVLTNTVVPLQFDPVLLCFAARQGWYGAIVLAVLGTVCAGIGAVIDLRVAGLVANRVWKSRSPWRLPWREHFLAVVAIAAFLPVPFTPVRASLVVIRPQPRRYVGAVLLGRLPRYLGAVIVLKALHLPDWTWEAVLAAMVALALALGLAHLVKTKKQRVRQENAGLAAC